MRRFIIEGENSQKHPGESRRNIVSNLNRAIEEEVGKRGRKGAEGASGPRQSRKLSKPGPKREDKISHIQVWLRLQKIRSWGKEGESQPLRRRSSG